MRYNQWGSNEDTGEGRLGTLGWREAAGLDVPVAEVAMTGRSLAATTLQERRTTPRRGPHVAQPQTPAHLVEFVSLLGLLLPTSLSSNSVFLPPPDLPVIILRALGERSWSGGMLRPLAAPPLPALFIQPCSWSITVFIAVTAALAAPSAG